MARVWAQKGKWHYGGTSKNHASERARKHIEEAREFSREVGGVDGDVKRYFFSLTPLELARLLNDYAARYGNDKCEYAKEAYAHWKCGARQMSGLVAQRLFDLLPMRMPLQMKYGLVKKLWLHFCPKSTKTFFVGPQPDLAALSSLINSHFQRVVQDYHISPELSGRFDWLAAGDVRVRQDFENHFQRLRTEILAEALGERLNAVREHIRNCPEDHRIQEVRIGNHVVEIRFSNHANGVADDSVITTIRQGIRKREQKKQNIMAGFWLVFWPVLIGLMLKACAR